MHAYSRYASAFAWASPHDRIVLNRYCCTDDSDCPKQFPSKNMDPRKYRYMWLYVGVVCTAARHVNAAVHYNDIIMSAVHLKSSVPPLFAQMSVQVQIKEYIKAQRHWPLCGEVTGEFHAQKTSNTENVSNRWRHHAYSKSCRVMHKLHWMSTHHPFLFG